jgi:uncharacterized protein
MSQSEHDRRIDYVEFPADDIPAVKRFYADVFGWKSEDYGPDYTSFHDGRLAGGFTRERAATGSGVLIVIYAKDLEAIRRRIVAAGGRIVREPFEFPGGRRFHFTDPARNELAVWSDIAP